MTYPRLLAVAVAVVLISEASAPALAQDPPRGIPRYAEAATVREVVDGDTLRVTFADGTHETVRLIGIDTPETRDPNEPDGCYGAEASARSAELVPPGREVWLEADRTDRNRYERLLRYVWVPKRDGGRYLLNEVMVRDGFALAVRYEPDTARAERLEAAQVRAVAAGRGLWSACPRFVATLTPVATEAPPALEPTPAGIASGPASGCDLSYPTVCIPFSPPDLDCGDIPHRRFQVLPPDPHRFDGDGYGVGCERDP